MRLLVAYPTFPEPDTNAGGLRLFEILRVLLAGGHRVTFLAASETDKRYREAIANLGIECLTYSPKWLAAHAVDFRIFLEERSFDIAILVHYWTYNIYAPYIRAFLPNCHVTLDTVDLHFLRLQREAAFSSDPLVHQHAEDVRNEETRALGDADSIWVVTELERQVLLRELSSDGGRVHVVPTIHRLQEGSVGYYQRVGIVHLGGYRHPPNVDGVRFFMEEVFPLLQKMLPQAKITIAGSHPPDEFLTYPRMASCVTVTGFVEDHRAVLASHRVGIAPLRFGAGMRGKIGEYLACGLPCVTTSIGGEGMDMENGRQAIIADDPYSFAHGIARLHQDSALWQELSVEGIRYVRNRLTPEVVASLVQNALASSLRPSRRGGRGAAWSSLANRLTPRQLLHLVKSSVRAVRSGGLGELRSRAKLWARRA